MKMKLLPLTLSFAALLAGCQPSAPPAARTTNLPLRIGAYYWPGEYWVDIAWKKGWFKEAGLNVEWIDTNTNYFGSFDDLVNGKLDTVDFYFFDFILYNARGKDLVGVINSDVSFGAEAIVARPGIESVRELSGKKVALSKNTYLEFLFTILARRDGLDLATVQLIDVPGEKAHEELIAGRADAILTWEPFVTDAINAAKGKKIFDTSEIPGVGGAVFAFQRKFIQERPNDVQAFARVWQRTTEFIKQKPDEAFAIVAEVNKKKPEEVKEFAKTDKILDLRDNELAFSFAAGFDSLHGAWRQMNDFMIEHDIVTNRVESARHLDSRFLQGLK